MSKLCKITIADRSFSARAGDRLLDAALTAGIDLPHDCRSGRCGSCLVRVVEGHVIGGDCDVPGAVRACQAVVLSSLRIEHDQLPPVQSSNGEVIAIRRLVKDVAELTIATHQPLAWLPGQYLKLRFEGFPERAYSPTPALDGRDAPGTFRLHMKLIAQGRVSGEIGRQIRTGHRVAIDGPHGSAYFRSHQQERLVMFAGGTGFAPIWSIADAALRESVSRRIMLIVGVRSIYSFYMAEALERMTQCPNVVVVPVVAEPQSVMPHIRSGNASDLADVIEPGDIVHAAGSPAMVDVLAEHAREAGIAFHADRFTPGTAAESGWLVQAKGHLLSRTRRILSRGASVRTPHVLEHG